jgi:plastocyanin
VRVSFSVATNCGSAWRGLLLGVWALVVVSVMAWSPTARGATEHIVTIRDFSFTPATVNIDKGDTVKWVWDSANTEHDHNVFFSNSLKSPLQQSGTFSVTFDNVGTFDYICQPHSRFGMKGQVVVRAAGALKVKPTENFSSTGTQGGPFSPDSKTYTLTNTGDSTINFRVTRSQNWVIQSPTNGSIAAGANTNVTLTINNRANELSPGDHQNTITFTNSTNDAGTTSRAVNLTVNAAPGGKAMPGIELLLLDD